MSGWLIGYQVRGVLEGQRVKVEFQDADHIPLRLYRSSALKSEAFSAFADMC